MPAVAVATMGTPRIDARRAVPALSPSEAKLKPRFSAFSSPSNGRRADFEQACGAWYAAGLMANESDQAFDTSDVARRLELAAGSDEVVRLAVRR